MFRIFSYLELSGMTDWRTGGRGQYLMRSSTRSQQNCIAGATALAVDRNWRIREINDTSSINHTLVEQSEQLVNAQISTCV